MQVVHLFVLLVDLIFEKEVIFDKLKHTACNVSTLIVLLAIFFTMCANHANYFPVESVNEIDIFGEHKFTVWRIWYFNSIELMSNNRAIFYELPDIWNVLCFFKGDTLRDCSSSHYLFFRAVIFIFEDATPSDSILDIVAHEHFITKINKYYLQNNHITLLVITYLFRKICGINFPSP